MDGSGKTTLTAGLHQYFVDQGLAVTKVKEPGFALPDLRALILATDFPLTRDGREIVLQADRALLSALIKKWSAANEFQVVVSDRSFLSGRVYSGTHDVDVSFVRRLEKSALWRYPDLILLLDLDPSESFRRTQARGESLTFEEQGGLQKYQQIREGFLKASREVSESKVVVIDANMKSPQDILAESVRVINEFYGGDVNGYL
jgi:dTMP kinase